MTRNCKQGARARTFQGTFERNVEGHVEQTATVKKKRNKLERAMRNIAFNRKLGGDTDGTFEGDCVRNLNTKPRTVLN